MLFKILVSMVLVADIGLHLLTADLRPKPSAVQEMIVIEPLPELVIPFPVVPKDPDDQEREKWQEKLREWQREYEDRGTDLCEFEGDCHRVTNKV